MTALEYASMQDHSLTAALIDKYDFSVKQTIQAYECAAIHAASPFELMKKATLLREEHGIPKTVLPPVECYGFQKEWETIEELEELTENNFQDRLACLLAIERISTENGLDMVTDQIWYCK